MIKKFLLMIGENIVFPICCLAVSYAVAMFIALVVLKMFNLY